MARKFVTTRELDLIDSWNKELIQGTSGQRVIYYGISYEGSQVHDVYDEAVLKEYLPPVMLDARVSYEQTATRAVGGTLDSGYNLVVLLHSEELRERNVRPREGDFVEYGQVIFEVTTVATNQPVFGQVNDKLLVKLTCVPSREGQFKADNSTPDGVDNTHPVEAARPRTLGDDL